LTDVDWTMSGEVVLMTLVGGLGTLFGPVVGAFIIVTMENYLAQTGSWVTIIEGVIFVVCVLTFRRGIVGIIAPYLAGTRTQSAALGEATAETSGSAPPA
jgi:branched-chain amino acid transport system permease protein